MRDERLQDKHHRAVFSTTDTDADNEGNASVFSKWNILLFFSSPGLDYSKS